MNRSSSDSGCIVVLLVVIAFVLLFGDFKVQVKSPPVTTPSTAK